MIVSYWLQEYNFALLQDKCCRNVGYATYVQLTISEEEVVELAWLYFALTAASVEAFFW